MNHDAPRYTKVASHAVVNGEIDTCLLLYSGGLDTSVMLTWLQEKYNCKVITLTVNIGQTVDDLDAIAKKAKKLGAIETITVDARDRFADELLSLAIKANADYQGGYALCTTRAHHHLAIGRRICRKIRLHRHRSRRHWQRQRPSSLRNLHHHAQP